MKLIKALTLSLGESGSAVFSRYQLGLKIYNLYRKKEYKGESIEIQKYAADRHDFNKYLNQLLANGVLSPIRGVQTAYKLVGNSHAMAEDMVCTIDPFSYVSHLSSMAYHGLTDRSPSKLFISSPNNSEWKYFAEERMKKDLKDEYELYMQNGLPPLQRTKLEKIEKTQIHRFCSKHLGAYKNVRDRSIRVATIGRTFLEMLRNPELCGGINHVLKTFDEHAQDYLRLITDEIDNNGNSIDKVRAGYILDERLSIANGVIERWIEYVQRGGSRKLDASSEYIPQWSDKWCLSLNVFE